VLQLPASPQVAIETNEARPVALAET